MSTPKMTFAECKYWLAEAASCQLRQDEELKKKNHYPFMIRYYEGNQGPEESQKKLCVINEYFPNVNALISEIMYQNPDIIAEASKPEGEENAPIMRSALTYAFKKVDALTENRLGLFDMIMAGYCAIDVNHINIKDTETVPQRFGKEKPLMGKIKDFLTGDKIAEELEKTLPPSEIAYSTPDETYVRRWNPLDVLFDYQAERIKDIRYTIKKIKWTYAKFVAMYPQYAGKVKTDSSIAFSMQADDKDKKTVLLYEFQLKQRDRFVNFIITPSFNLHEIDYFERPYTTNGFNLKIGTLSEYGALYPVSFAQINKAIQDDINNYATFMMQVAERNIPKIGIDKNKVKEDGIAGLRSTLVNDLVPVDGVPANSIHPLQPTKVSIENKELLAIFEKQKEKLWAVSSSRQGVTSGAKFMGELEIQEAGFMARQADIQEGLRKLIVSEVETLKDIIVSFWDGPMWFKITGAQQPTWYEPKEVPNPLKPGETMVENALTDILTRDYELDVDISTSLKPNKERKKQELIKFLELMISPNMLQFLMVHKLTISPEAIKKTAKEWGWNPESLLIEMQPAPAEGEVPPEELPPEELPPEELPPEELPPEGAM